MKFKSFKFFFQCVPGDLWFHFFYEIITDLVWNASFMSRKSFLVDSFIYFFFVYISLVCPQLEYTVKFSCLAYGKGIERLEKVQTSAHKLMLVLRNNSYEDRLRFKPFLAVNAGVTWSANWGTQNFSWVWQRGLALHFSSKRARGELEIMSIKTNWSSSTMMCAGINSRK